MRVSPSKDLSQHFKHIPILASAGIGVKGLIPELAICPFCRQHQFSIYPDPVATAGKWMYCGKCHFSGDCVELYGRLNGSPSLMVAVRQATSDGFSSVPEAQLLGEDIETYVSQFPARRKEHKARWNQLRAGLTENIRPDVVNRLQAEHLWGGWCNGYQDRMLRFLGAGTREEVIDIMGMENRTLPKNLFKTALALNFQDAPGRLCAFMFVGETGFRVVKSVTENVGDGGLAMLDALLPHEQLVYAVDDPLFALHVQKRQFADHPEPLKVVIYNHMTGVAWNSVSADKVVLWSRVKDWQVFNHARRVRNGYVAAVPRLGATTEELYGYLHAYPLAAALKRMANDAKPWPLALCEWITAHDVSESSARDAIAKLELTPNEKQLTIDSSPKSLRDRVTALLGDSKIYITRVLSGRMVTEREDGLYVFRANSGEERITDALVKVDTEICDTAAGKAVWRGNIRFKGVDIPYQAPVETIERHFSTWLTGCTVRAGLGTPLIALNWSKQMSQAVRLFSTPKSTQSLAHIGVQVSGDIIFPQFKIVGSHVRDIATFFGDNAPGSCVLPPLSRPSVASDVANPARSCWVALAAAYMANLMSEERQLPVLPVLAVGPHGSVARMVARQFAKAADMPMLPLDKTRRICEISRAKLNPYGYPSYLESGLPGHLRYYPVVNRDNVFLAVDTLEASALSVGGRWLSIRASKLYTEQCLPPLHDVFIYLADLQRRDYELNLQVPLHEALLDDFCAWYSRHLGVDQASTHAEAKACMQAPRPAGDGLLDLCYWFYSSGELSLIRREFMAQLLETEVFRTTAGIVIDEEAKRVYVSRRHLFRAINAHQLPTPDVTAGIDDLTHRGLIADVGRELPGWLIDMEYWHKQAAAWQQASKQAYS